MATFYQKMRTMASSLAAKFGQSGVVINRYSRISIPATGEVVLVLEQTTTATAIRDTEKKQAYPQSSAGVSYRRYLVPSASVAWSPAVLDEIVVDGATWAITACEPVSPGGTDVVYMLTVEASTATTLFVAGYGFSYGYLYGGVNV